MSQMKGLDIIWRGSPGVSDEHLQLPPRIYAANNRRPSLSSDGDVVGCPGTSVGDSGDRRILELFRMLLNSITVSPVTFVQKS